MPGPINRHNRRGDDELSRRYRRKRDEDPSYPDELDDDPYDDVDDYWNPRAAAGALDFYLQLMWEQVLSVALAPSLLDFLPEPERAAWTPGAAPTMREIAVTELPDALHRHLDSAISRTSRHDYLERLRQAGTIDDIRAAVLKTPVLGRWFADQRGPAVMALVLAPFWLRPLTAWSPPEPASDVEDLTVSLLDHLFARYPLPKVLYDAWRGASLPTLKWACWTVLLGHGASLHRAAPTFGWHVTARFTHHLLAAPPELGTVDAVMWAEIVRLGGSPAEYTRLSAHHAYRIDPTSGPVDPARVGADDDDEAPWDEERTNTTPGFWRATVGWLAHHRGEIDDAECQLILDWAMHRHTEDLALRRAEHECFSWHNRDAAAAVADATRYRDLLQGRHRAGRFDGSPLTWKRRGWDWEDTRDDVTWSMREITADTELLDEGFAMRHCVSSYAYPCARGETTIFSLRRNGLRRATVQIDPLKREIVQARGVRNRTCDREELDVVARWLATLS